LGCGQNDNGKRRRWIKMNEQEIREIVRDELEKAKAAAGTMDIEVNVPKYFEERQGL
jgi:hypothetical protein